jgi:hypothetical protein
MAVKFTTTKKGGEFVKVLIYGQSGVGKTKLSATAPKPVIISSEKKLISLKDSNIPVLLIENHTDLQEAYDIVTGKKGSKFETVVVDSISDIAETILDHFKKNPVDGNTHPQAAYGSMADTLAPLIKKFRDITDKHVYFIAKSKMIEDQYTNVSMFSPSLPGKVLPGNISYEFDYVFAMRIGETEKGKKYRFLQTQADIQWIAKGVESLNTIEKPDLTHIFNKILGKDSKLEKEVESTGKE